MKGSVFQPRKSPVVKFTTVNQSQRQSGFTLIEIMIVVAIIAIISAVAYPSYMEQIRKTRRADAQIKLQEIAQLQESYFARNFTYASMMSGLLNSSSNTLSSDEGYYSLTISAATGEAGAACAATRANPCTTYTLQAVPQTGTTQTKDTSCSRFNLDHMGRKSAIGAIATADTTAQCW